MLLCPRPMSRQIWHMNRSVTMVCAASVLCMCSSSIGHVPSLAEASSTASGGVGADVEDEDDEDL